jgi:NitT/TauT family transport system permease protein
MTSNDASLAVGSDRPQALRRARAGIFRRELSPGAARLGIIVAAIVVWEISARLFGDPLFVAPPSLVVFSLGKLFGTAGIPHALSMTAIALGSAFVLSVLFGVVLGVTLGLSRFAHRSFMPIVLLLYATPQATIIPIFMMVFGIGLASKIAYGFSHGIFPIIVTVAAGVQNIKPILLTSSRSMGATRWQIFQHVVFPHMIPSLFSGMRLGMTATLLGVILAELYASTTGVGYFSQQFATNFQPPLLYGLIFVVAAIAVLINEALRRAEARLTRWRRA